MILTIALKYIVLSSVMLTAPDQSNILSVVTPTVVVTSVIMLTVSASLKESSY